MHLIIMNWPHYVPNVPKIPGEYYNSFDDLKKNRPDIFEEKKHGYHIKR